MLKRKNHKSAIILFAIVLCIGFFDSCTSKKPKVLSASKLEQVLYDYHFAEAMAAENGIDSVKAQQYLDAVFRKHGITQEEFDTTMIYYLRHAGELNDIYANLNERINNEVQLQGLDGTATITTDVNADTANIWNQATSKVFFAHSPYNLMKFHLKSDSTFKSGDRFILKFRSNFLYQDGVKNGYAVLSVKLKNDSVITRTTSMTSSMEYSLDITDVKEEGIEEVRGFIMQRYGNYETNKRSSTLRIMYVGNISLVRMHKKQTDEDENKDDSSEVNNSKDINNKDEKTDSIKPLGADSVGKPKRGMHKLHSR